MIEPISLGLAALGGFALGMAVMSRMTAPTRSQVELTHQNIALTILAGEAIGRLDQEDREALEEQADELMESAFGDGAGVEIEGVSYDE